MKKIAAFIAIPLLVFASAACQRPAEDISKIKYPELEFKAPKTNRVVLKNGMVLHLLENHELPIVEIDSMVRIGSAYESAGKRGLASITGSVWRIGGTKSVSPDDLDEELEFIAAAIETGIGSRSGAVSMSVLKKDIDKGLKLFADIIMNPAFDEKRFAVAKASMLEGIRRQNDDPSGIAGREFSKLIYQGHIFGVTPTVETVQSITIEDCRSFYYDHVGPESFIIGITGDFDSGKMAKRIEKLFADFKPAKKKLPAIPALPKEVKPGVYMVNKAVPQTVVRAGHFGASRKNPDYYPLKVMNYILGGGGFSSRLLKEIRSTRGLAYSVWSYFSWGYDDNGVFAEGGETKAKSTYEFIEALGSITKDVINNGITEEELSLAKESIVNSFVHAFDKDAKIVSQYMTLDYYGMPEDYLEKFRERIDAVTLEKVKEVAGKYLHPDKMVILAVGDGSIILKDMEKLGTVKEIKLKQ